MRLTGQNSPTKQKTSKGWSESLKLDKTTKKI